MPSVNSFLCIGNTIESFLIDFVAYCTAKVTMASVAHLETKQATQAFNGLVVIPCLGPLGNARGRHSNIASAS